jgi:hypothetical protein
MLAILSGQGSSLKPFDLARMITNKIIDSMARYLCNVVQMWLHTC